MPARKRPLMAFAVALAVLIATPLAVVASDAFNDVADSNVHHDDITWLADTGVTKGCNPPENTNYCPEDAVTRQQMASFLRRLAENQVVDAATAVTAGDADTLDGLDSSAFVTEGSARPWNVSMPIEAAFWFDSIPSMRWEQGGGGAAAAVGLSMDDSGFSRFYHGFTLPVEYQDGTDVDVRLAWAADDTNPEGCGFVIEINGLRAMHAGAPIRLLERTWENPPNPSFPDRAILAAPPSPGPGNGYRAQVGNAVIAIDGESLHSGDQVTLAINRDQDETGDSCPGKIIILGLTAESR